MRSTATSEYDTANNNIKTFQAKIAAAGSFNGSGVVMLDGMTATVDVIESLDVICDFRANIRRCK